MEAIVTPEMEQLVKAIAQVRAGAKLVKNLVWREGHNGASVKRAHEHAGLCIAELKRLLGQLVVEAVEGEEKT